LRIIFGLASSLRYLILRQAQEHEALGNPAVPDSRIAKNPLPKHLLSLSKISRLSMSMDARFLKISAIFLGVLLSANGETISAAVFRTPNFVVTADTQVIARQVGQTAEKYRKFLAVEWLGKAMPQWYSPCTVRVRVGQIGAGGATTFSFDRGHVFGWKMQVQGTLERILDSVIPHEVSHTIFASYFRRPLPRWADEGAATLVEHYSEKRVQQLRLKQIFNTPKRIPLRRLLSMKQYPTDMQQMLILYAEGYSLADFLVQKGGRTTYLRFLNDAHRNGWDAAIKRHYNIANVEALEKTWGNWFLAGSPDLKKPRSQQLAAASSRNITPGTIIRSQSPGPNAPQRISLPLTDANAEENTALVAPDPKRSARSHETAGWAGSSRDSVWNRKGAGRTTRTTSLPTAGRLKTLKEGWVPIIRHKRRDAVNFRDKMPRTSF
jgi:hypothetical protein